ncbi:hypothetical protein JOF55_003641 [Haloactinomyces albus]|uniref:Uncharacterized protein n=1 Tax=Haloactinomyces albus TaxID=1352928 RepID=A0AAE4CMJ7_9ACTN|nr:hypothetical protein [Haloactinomyces albus]
MPRRRNSTRTARCYERLETVIDAFFDLADAIIRALIRRAWTHYRRDARPAKRP